MDSLFKQVLTSQTIFGAFQSLLVLFGFGGVLVSLEVYHARETFSCSPKPDDFTKQLCHDKYTSTMSPWLIPRNVVAIIYGVLSACWICFLIYSDVEIRQIKTDKEAQPNQRKDRWKKLRRMYNVHVVFRLLFLGGMIGAFCSSQTLDLPSVFECSLRTPQTNKTATSVNKTESTMQCNDLLYKEKSNLNILIIIIQALVMILGISELLQLKLTGKPFQKMLLRNVPEEPNNPDRKSQISDPNSSGETNEN